MAYSFRYLTIGSHAASVNLPTTASFWHCRFRYRATVIFRCPFPPCIASAQPLISCVFALFDHGFASKSDQRFAYFRSTGNLTFLPLFNSFFDAFHYRDFSSGTLLKDQSVRSWCTSLSGMASAVVGFSIRPCHLSTGNWLTTIVLLLTVTIFCMSSRRSLHWALLNCSSPQIVRD